ncbi:MAG: AzlC family ABC transporter permease [Thalassobaculales bacterium]
MGRSPSFTRQGLRRGARAVLVFVPSVVLFGLALGVTAAAAGLSLGEAVLMSGWVNAGGAQMAALQVWSEPPAVAALCLTVLAMNTRYLLLGAALRPWFGALPAWQSYPSLLVMGDGNWALALREHAAGRDDAAHLAGSGLVLWLAWVGATMAGHLFGQVLGDPRAWGVDFILGAFFATMAVGFFRSAASILPFLVGAVVAVAVDRLLPGPWSLLAGALAGSLAGLVRPPAAIAGGRTAGDGR